MTAETLPENDRRTLLLVNGPNLNLLGERNPQVYGHSTLSDVERLVSDAAVARMASVVAFQSNHEGAIIDFLHDRRRQASGILLNAGGLTHTSVALRDAIEAVQLPCVEIHISNTHARDSFRHSSLIAAACIGQVAGLGVQGYVVAANLLLDHLESLRVLW